MVIRMEERLENLERTLEEIIRLNAEMPVVVEGKRDVTALREIGLGGEIIVTNDGGPLIALCDRLAERYREIILLVDWDRTGGQIMRVMRDNLMGRVRLHDELRKALAIYAEVRDVESLPAYLATLRRKVSLASRTPEREQQRERDPPPRAADMD